MIYNISDIREKGFNALTKELGSTGMAIFIRQFENGKGNYSEERDKLFEDLTIDNIVDSIKKRKADNHS